MKIETEVIAIFAVIAAIAVAYIAYKSKPKNTGMKKSGPQRSTPNERDNQREHSGAMKEKINKIQIENKDKSSPKKVNSGYWAVRISRNYSKEDIKSYSIEGVFKDEKLADILYNSIKNRYLSVTEYQELTTDAIPYEGDVVVDGAKMLVGIVEDPTGVLIVETGKRIPRKHEQNLKELARKGTSSFKAYLIENETLNRFSF